MSETKIVLDDDRTAFRPGEAIVGRVSWERSEPPESLTLRLLWYSRGKARREARAIAGETFRKPSPSGIEPFCFRAPIGPHSFHGKLVSLQWALELVIEPEHEAQRELIVIAPSREEIELHRRWAEDEDKTKKS